MIIFIFKDFEIDPEIVEQQLHIMPLRAVRPRKFNERRKERLRQIQGNSTDAALSELQNDNVFSIIKLSLVFRYLQGHIKKTKQSHCPINVRYSTNIKNIIFMLIYYVSFQDKISFLLQI